MRKNVIMPPISFSGNTLKLVYSNDWHANANNIKCFASGVKSIRKENNNTNPLLVLIQGDASMDVGMESGTFVQKAIRKIRVNTISKGNHDMEGGDFWAAAYKKAEPFFGFLFKRKQPRFVSANIKYSRENPIEKIVSKSTLLTCKSKNGTVKVGIVGASPFDYKQLTFIDPHNDYIDVMDFESTLKAITEEADKLRKQGAETVIGSFHTGEFPLVAQMNSSELSLANLNYYKEFAETDKFDVILGGHDHREVDYWYTTKTGKMVKIVSIGRTPTKNIIGMNLDSFGELKLVFDDNNKLLPEQCENKVHITSDYPASKKIQRLENRYLKPHKVIGYTENAIEHDYTKMQEIPIANLSADSSLWVVNSETKGEKAQIAIVTAGAIKEGFPKGKVTIGKIREAFPYTAPILIKTTLTKAQLMATLNQGSRSIDFNRISPGVIQVGGMQYTIGRDNLIKEAYLLDKDGALLERIDTQPDDKKYTVVYDSFLMKGPASLKELVKESDDPNVEYFPYSRQDAAIKYINNKFKNKPIQVQTGRVKLEGNRLNSILNQDY